MESAANKKPDKIMPWGDSAAANYLARQIDALRTTSGISQREIANAMGYKQPNIMSMFKSGETKIPIDKIAIMAKVLKVDPANFGRMVIMQHWPTLAAQFEQIFGGGMVSKNERKLLENWRKATNNIDPTVNDTVFDAAPVSKNEQKLLAIWRDVSMGQDPDPEPVVNDKANQDVRKALSEVLLDELVDTEVDAEG